MPMTDSSRASILDLLFLNINWANVGDATGLRGASTAGSYFLALHSADPGASGNQSTNEVAYTGYARVAVARGAGGFTRSGSTASNTALVQFPVCTGGSATATHFSVGVASSGATQAVLTGPLNASLSISNQIQPQFAASSLTATVN